NQFHGSAYDYFVNEALNAGQPFTTAPKDYFVRSSGETITASRWAGRYGFRRSTTVTTRLSSFSTWSSSARIRTSITSPLRCRRRSIARVTSPRLLPPEHLQRTRLDAPLSKGPSTIPTHKG